MTLFGLSGKTWARTTSDSNNRTTEQNIYKQKRCHWYNPRHPSHSQEICRGSRITNLAEFWLQCAQV